MSVEYQWINMAYHCKDRYMPLSSYWHTTFLTWLCCGTLQKYQQSSLQYCCNINIEVFGQESLDTWFCCPVLAFIRCFWVWVHKDEYLKWKVKSNCGFGELLHPSSYFNPKDIAMSFWGHIAQREYGSPPTPALKTSKPLLFNIVILCFHTNNPDCSHHLSSCDSSSFHHQEIVA